MQTLTISNRTSSLLNEAAALRGIDANAYAEEILSIGLAVLRQLPTPAAKLYSVMDFAGIAPSGRTAEEIDAEIEAGRAEWEAASRETERV